MRNFDFTFLQVICDVWSRLQGEDTLWHFKGHCLQSWKDHLCSSLFNVVFSSTYRHQDYYYYHFILFVFSSPLAATGLTQPVSAHIAPGYVIYELFNRVASQTKLIFRHFLLSPVSSVSHSALSAGNDLYSCGISLARACAHWCNTQGMLNKARNEPLHFPPLLARWWFLPLSPPTTPSFASPEPHKLAFKYNICSFISQPQTMFDSTFSSFFPSPPSCIISYLHHTLHPY